MFTDGRFMSSKSCSWCKNFAREFDKVARATGRAYAIRRITDVSGNRFHLSFTRWQTREKTQNTLNDTTDYRKVSNFTFFNRRQSLYTIRSSISIFS